MAEFSAAAHDMARPQSRPEPGPWRTGRAAGQSRDQRYFALVSLRNGMGVCFNRTTPIAQEWPMVGAGAEFPDSSRRTCHPGVHRMDSHREANLWQDRAGPSDAVRFDRRP